MPVHYNLPAYRTRSVIHPVLAAGTASRRFLRCLIPAAAAFFLTAIASFLFDASLITAARAQTEAAHAQNPATRQPLVGISTGQVAPAFTLVDAQKGKPAALTSWRGHPVTLFFFCGCSECLAVAKGWAQLQRNGTLTRKGLGTGAVPPSAKSQKGAAVPVPEVPVTMIVYSGDASGAKSLATRAGLDMESGKTIVLIDPALRVTDSLYHVESCPRAFVLNSSGAIQFTNNSADNSAETTGQGRKAEEAEVNEPAESLVARTQESLLRCLNQPKSQSQSRPSKPSPKRAGNLPAKSGPKKVSGYAG